MTAEAVKVIVRCRPLNKREKDLKCKTILTMQPNVGQCYITHPGDQSAPAKSFTFDGAYYTDSTTENMYNEIVFPIVESVTEGYNGTVFAYGQTGCGKSFTMQGVSSPAAQRGIIPRAFEHIFEAIATSEKTKFIVHASYLEIYNEDIHDLLGKDSKKKLDLKEQPDSGVYVNGLSTHPVHNVQECEKVMDHGWKNRAVGATLMNADSSRSHSIFTVYLERIETDYSTDNNIRKGKLNLVDLAGSERQGKTGATGDRLKEATKINLSLSALGNVISALVDGKSKHIPYRDSKLTRLLQDSLGGNTKTLMVACLSPADNNYDETLSTLRYANRAKNIKNKPKINEDPKDALLREYQEEINRLKTMIGDPIDGDHMPRTTSAIDEEEVQRIKADYDKKMQELIEKYKEEQESNMKLKNDMSKLKETYEQQISGSTDGGPDQEAEAIERLQALQDIMVGGEKADDTELKERRARRKRIAEKKINAISDALKNFDDDDQLLLKAYGDITEELRARTLLVKRAKKKITSLERETSDLQSEFEQDRTDYLETIRRQEQQVKLYTQILEKMQPCIRRDCNYASVDRIKAECVWDEDLQKWRLPELIVTRTKLPPPSGSVHPGLRTAADNSRPSTHSHGVANGGMLGSGDSGRSAIDEEDPPIAPVEEELLINESGSGLSGDKLFERLEKGAQENLAANYFKPKRREQLLNRVQKVTNANDGQANLMSHNGGQFNGSSLATRNALNNLNNQNNNLTTINTMKGPQDAEKNNFFNNFQDKLRGHNHPEPIVTVVSKSVPSTSNGLQMYSKLGVTLSAMSTGRPGGGQDLRKPVRLESIRGLGDQK